jgi:phospholipid transport system substrate-binding protein
MRRLRSVVGGLLIAAGVVASAQAHSVDTGSTEFISSLGNQALEVIRSDTALAQKLMFFHQLLDRDFDMRAISRFVLGPYWRTATPSERDQFAGLLADDLVRFYDRRFAEYHGETLQVSGSRPNPAGVIVTSRIIRPSGPPIDVNWQLNIEGGVYKITDVIIDGVSMAVSGRAEIAHRIAGSGGNFANLLEGMQGPEVGSSVAPPPAAGTGLPPLPQRY